ncbi:TPA: hypothetical protein ACGO5C_001960, partial [Streptococcus suis]
LISKFFYDIQNNIIERTGYFTVYRQSGLILVWTAGGDTPTFQLLTEINNHYKVFYTKENRRILCLQKTQYCIP